MSISTHITDPSKRLEIYIEEGAKLIEAAFGINFESDLWQLPAKRAAGMASHRLDFTTFQDPYKGLLKAVVSHETATRQGRGSFGTVKAVRDARYLATCVSGIENLTHISTDHFHRAGTTIKERLGLSDFTKYESGKTLAQFARILTRNRLTKTRITFTNPIAPPETTGDKHMIPPGAIRAFGETWQEIMAGRNNDKDRFLACTVALLLCTGFRINELLSMPVECWHPAQGKDSQGRILDGVFLGYAPEKNGLTEATYPKWIASDLIPLARECLDEILRITQPFRENARAMHEGRVKLQGLEDGRTYKASEAAELLGYSLKGFRNLLRRKGTFKKIPGCGSGGQFSLNAQEIRMLIQSSSFLERVIMDPWSQDLHDSLFVISSGFFSPSENGMNGSADRVKRESVYSFLTSNSKQSGNKSCFERYRKKDPETGKFWRFATHDPRHTFTTWMKRAGLSELEIAAYFGRNTRDPATANENYDHIQPWELLEIVRKALERGEFTGPYSDILANVKDPIRKAELTRTMLGNISYSKLGLCAHAEGTTPPTIPEACARCPGLIVVKGNSGHIKEAKEQLEECEHRISRYQGQVTEGYFGKNRWLAVEMERRNGLVEILKIHMDVKIPHGRLVQISPYRNRQQKNCI